MRKIKPNEILDSRASSEHFNNCEFAIIESPIKHRKEIHDYVKDINNKNIEIKNFESNVWDDLEKNKSYLYDIEESNEKFEQVPQVELYESLIQSVGTIDIESRDIVLEPLNNNIKYDAFFETGKFYNFSKTRASKQLTQENDKKNDQIAPKIPENVIAVTMPNSMNTSYNNSLVQFHPQPTYIETTKPSVLNSKVFENNIQKGTYPQENDQNLQNNNITSDKIQESSVFKKKRSKNDNTAILGPKKKFERFKLTSKKSDHKKFDHIENINNLPGNKEKT